MLKQSLALIILAVLAAGCGVKAQTYVMTKERVDQAAEGNGGCLSGQCASAPEPDKKTRKVYILEVTKVIPESEAKKIEQAKDAAVSEPSTEAVPTSETPQRPQDVMAAPLNIPVIEDAPAAAKPADTSIVLATAQTYTVVKDDTLQKIAKKFYNSYSKWIKIYEANKEKIKNPNFVKPGTVLTIPATE